MSAIRAAGQINESTTLIDIGMYGVRGVTAVYLLRGRRTCLIDAGTRQTAPRLVKELRKLGAFPPDLVVLSHAHADHAQGICLLRREAAKQGKTIDVLAGGETIPLLADASFNDVFGGGPYESIQEVTSVAEGDTIYLEDLTLRVYDVPGHSRGHIAVLDEKNRTIFVGDAIGIQTQDDIFLPPFLCPTWDPDAFLSSVDKLSQVPYETLCLAHFGCVSGMEANSILDEAVETYTTWWRFYEKHADRLTDTAFLLQAMRAELNPGAPVIRPWTLRSKVLLGLVKAAGTATGRKGAFMDKLYFADTLGELAISYEAYTMRQAMHRASAGPQESGSSQPAS